MLANWLPIGFLAGLAIASLPAFFAGASMWAIGDSYGAARHPLAWAAAGAAVGGGLWVVFGILLGPDEIGADGWALCAASLIAGAGGALAFLGAMRQSGRL